MPMLPGIKEVWFYNTGDFTCIAFVFFLPAYSKNSPSYFDKDRLVPLMHTIYILK